MDDADDSGCIFNDARDDSAVNGHDRNFNDIDFQYVPEAAVPFSVGHEALKVTKDSDSVAGKSGDSVRQRSPRPARNRVRPKRYEG